MTDAPISPLRRRMIEDMTVRKFAERTQEAYIRAVKNFSTFLGASPDTASAEDLRRYRLHLVASGAGVPTLNHRLTALRFLFIGEGLRLGFLVKRAHAGAPASVSAESDCPPVIAMPSSSSVASGGNSPMIRPP